MVFKYFMVSATHVPSHDALEQQTTETANYSALMELTDFSICLSFIHEDQDRPCLEGAMLSTPRN